MLRSASRGNLQVTRLPRRHLTRSELVDATGACPICLADLPRRQAVRVQADPDVFMLACPRCRACSASHMPRPEVLARYYADFYDGHGARQVTFSDPTRFANHIVGSLPRDATWRELRLLDFGGGDGSLSRRIAERLIARGRARHVSIVVVDFLPGENAAGGALSVRFQLPDEPLGDAYHLVLASAILEHVPHLHRLLPALYGALAPAGLFYARTPYAIPLARFVPRLDLGYPAHLHDMGSPFWNRLQKTFEWSGRVLASRPSLVAGTLTGDPVRTIAAVALKLPAHVESVLSPRRRHGRLWHLVGGWEVLLQRA